MALSFPGVQEKPHFEKTAFFVKSIFTTLDEAADQACLMMTPADQAAFCGIDPAIIFPVPNKWGLRGATIVLLQGISEELLADALTCAYIAKAPKALAAPFLSKREIS